MKKIFYFILMPIFLFINTNILYSAEKTNIGSPVAVQSKEDKRLAEAVLSNDLKTIMNIIDNGRNIEYTIYGGMTPLMLAAENSSFETVKLLIDKGANVNAYNTYLNPGIQCKCPQQNYNNVSYDKNDYDPGHNKTVLMYAMNNKDLKVAELLLDKGANINAKDLLRKTVLMYAVDKNNLQMVKLLIDRGANTNAEDSRRENVLFYALAKNNLQIMELLIDRGANINAKDRYPNVKIKYLNDNETVLMKALSSGNLKMAKLLIDKGAIISDRYTLLISAIESNNLETINFMISKGININETDKCGNTALMKASMLESAEIINFLIDKGANINAADVDGKNALFLAVEKSRGIKTLETIKLLVARGVNINWTDKNGETVLFYALRNEYGFPFLQYFIVDKKMDVTVKNKSNQTPLMVATQYENAKAVELIKKTTGAK